MVLVDRIDLATARAIQYARTLTPDDLHAVHFNIDHTRTDFTERWQRAGLPGCHWTWSTARTGGSGGPRWSWQRNRLIGETEVSMKVAAPLLRKGVAPDPPRPDGRPDRRGRQLQLPARERDDHPLPRLGRHARSRSSSPIAFSSSSGREPGARPGHEPDARRAAAEPITSSSVPGTTADRPHWQWSNRPAPPAGSGRSAAAAPVGGADDRSRGGGRQRRGHHVRLPRPAFDRRVAERDPHGGGGHGRQAPAQARHDQLLPPTRLLVSAPSEDGMNEDRASLAAPVA